MTTSVGDIVATMSVDVAELRSGLATANGLLNSHGAQMNTILGAIERRSTETATAIKGAVIAYATAMATHGLKASIDFATQIKLTADTLEISTDALQEFRYAMEQNGTSADKADELLGHFTQKLGEAAKGSLQAQQELLRLGITMDDLRHKNVAALFTQATDSASRFTSVAERNNALIDTFGKMAKTSVPALTQSAAQMDKLRLAAAGAGQVLDKDVIVRAEELKKRFDAAATSLEVTLGPIAVSVFEKIAAGAKYVGSLFKDLFSNPAKGTAEELGVITDRLASLRAELERSTTRQTRQGLVSIEAPEEEQRSPRGGWRQDSPMYMRQEIARLEAERAAIETSLRAQRDTGPAAAPNAQMSKEGIEYLHKLRDETEKNNIAILDNDTLRMNAELRLAEREQQQKLQTLGLWVTDTKSATSDQKAAMQEYYDWQASEQAMLVKKFETPAEKMLDAWRNTTRQMQDATAKWLDGAAGALTTFARTGKLDFASFANSVIDDLIRIQIQKGLAGVSGSLSGAFGSLFGGGAAPVATDFSAGSDFGYTDGALAGGGDADAGKRYLVGENGPEMFIPKTSGTVIPNHALGGGGGMNLSVSVDARGSSVTGDGDSAQALGAKIGNVVRSVIVAERRPGGLLA